MRSKIGIVFLMVTIFICLSTPNIYPCTAFTLKHGDRILFGENFDWSVGDGLIIVNKRNVKKNALIFRAGDQRVASWISKYGSLTFNHVGREFFHGGINSKGLFVTGLILGHSEYPPIDSRPIISQTQWKQYILDNCATVGEAIAAQSQIRIFPRIGRFPVHFFIADKDGQSAVIEFIDGKMIYYTGANMPVNVLTNSTYADSTEYLKEHKGFGGERSVSTSRNSFNRFVHTASMVKSYNAESSGPAVNYGFKILEGAAQGEYTVWRIIYDVNEMRIYFRTTFNFQIQYIDVGSFDFSCDTPNKVFDLNNKVSGDVAKYFKDYTTSANRDLITRVNSLYHLPQEVVDVLERYPEDMFCGQE